METTPEDVLAFWFGDAPQDAAAFREKLKRWYSGGPDFDRAIRERFSSTVERALAGDLDDWARTPRGRLALVIVLDQLTRNTYRDDPRTYAGDARAQRLAVEALDAGLDRSLDACERMFLQSPLLHAEDAALQERSVAEMERLAREAPQWQRPMLAMGVEQAHKYREIIARFGRFPHRNAVLGRASTPDEDAFLVGWKERQPPSNFKHTVG